MIEINEKQKKELIKKLNEKYKGDFSFLENYLIFKNSENKYFIFNGKFVVNGDRIGLEAFKEEFGKIRLYFQFANMFKEEIKDFFFEVDKENAKRFLAGEDLELEELLTKNGKKINEVIDKEFYLLKYEGYFIGVGKVIKNLGVLKNYLGKQYRFKNIVL
jgi:NOL1/NOP2/fmu family ribosome biogenesis protein